MAESSTPEEMPSSDESSDGVPLHIPAKNLMLYVTGTRVLRVEFTDRQSWPHETSWNCIPTPDQHYLFLSNDKLSSQLCELKKTFKSRGEYLTSIHNGSLIFVFGHETEYKATLMGSRHSEIKEAILLFLHEIGTKVKDIKLEAVVQEAKRTVKTQIQQKGVGQIITGMDGDSTAIHSNVSGIQHVHEMHQGNTYFLGDVYNVNCEGKHETSWHCNLEPDRLIPNFPRESLQSFGRRIRQFCRAKLRKVTLGSLIFSFAHSTIADAFDMVTQHNKVKEVILDFVRELDPSIEDIRMQVVLRELIASEEQTTQTTDAPPGGTTDQDVLSRPKHEEVEDTSLSHPQKTEVEDGSLPHSQQTEVEDASLLDPQQTELEDTSLLDPQQTEVEDASLLDPQQTEVEDTSHSHPQQTEVEDTSHSHPQKTLVEEKYLSSMPGSGSHSSGYSPVSHSSLFASSDPSLSEGDPLDPWMTQESAPWATPSQADCDLHFASQMGDLDEVRRILDSGQANINTTVGWRSRTPVMEAAVRGHRDVVELLVSKGADVSLVDDDGYNLLYIACQKGDIETVKFVLSLHVVDINSRGEDSRTPVMAAADRGHRDVVELLVSKGADVSLVDRYGNSLLYFACQRGDTEMVKFVLSLNVADINSRGRYSRTPVMEAAYNGHRKVVKLLLSKGADVSLVDDDGNSLLYPACQRGDIETVKSVLSINVVDINSRGRKSRTPVMEAAYKGHTEVAKLLCSKGADVSLVDDGYNLLYQACKKGDIAMVRFVLSLTGVDINRRVGRWSWTPVMVAAHRGHRDVVELLVSQGADVSLVDDYGDNLLHFACIGGNIETVKFVLSLIGVDIDAKNNSGRTAADRARLGGHDGVEELLKSRGAH